MSTSTTQHITTQTALPPYKSALLASCLSAKSLTFGTFTLKSGRVSPYFFNAGSLHTGRLLRTLSQAFAITISKYFGDSADQPNADPGFDIIFGPAYKGIPLAANTVEALSRLDDERYGDVSLCFNRKEQKAYGDKGTTVGASMKGKRVLIIDDVMTAGTAVAEAVGIIEKEGGKLVGIVIALDRMERAPSRKEKGEAEVPGEKEETRSTIGVVRDQLGVPIHAVLTLNDILEGYRAIGSRDDISRLEEYREKYRAVD